MRAWSFWNNHLSENKTEYVLSVADIPFYVGLIEWLTDGPIDKMYGILSRVRIPRFIREWERDWFVTGRRERFEACYPTDFGAWFCGWVAGPITGWICKQEQSRGHHIEIVLTEEQAIALANGHPMWAEVRAAEPAAECPAEDKKSGLPAS